MYEYIGLSIPGIHILCPDSDLPKADWSQDASDNFKNRPLPRPCPHTLVPQSWL